MNKNVKNLITLFKTSCLIIKSNPFWVIIRLLRYIYTALSAIIPAYILKFIINELAYDKLTKNTIIYIIIFAAFGLINSIFTIALGHYDQIINAKINNQLHYELNSAIMSMTYEHLERPEMQEFLALVKAGQSKVLVIIDSIFSFASSCIHLAIYFSAIGTVEPLLALIIVFCVIVRSVIKIISTKVKRKHFTKENKLSFRSAVFSRLVNRIEFGKEVRLLNISDWLIKKCRNSQRIVNKSSEKLTSSNLKFLWGIDFIGRFETFFAYLFIGWKAFTSKILIGDFYFYFNCANQFSNAIANVTDTVTDIFDHIDVLKEYNLCMTESTDSKKEEEKRIKCSSDFCIEFVGVSFHYPNSDINILNNISFVINDKEKVSFVGENGAGKTTIIKLICRFYQPTQGIILLNGKNITEYDIYDYYKKIGAVFQDFKIYAFSIEENITIGNSGANIYELCDKVGMKSKIDSLPEGIQTYLSKEFENKGIEFSGGEKQKIAIIRALYKKPGLLILDEPAASLDPIAESEVFNSISKISQNCTTILVSHHLASSKFVDKIIVLDRGSIIECGSHKQLIMKKGKYYNMFTLQASKYK